jgi:hypothetical protein
MTVTEAALAPKAGKLNLHLCSVSVCVCVCERERERERESGGSGMLLFLFTEGRVCPCGSARGWELVPPHPRLLERDLGFTAAPPFFFFFKHLKNRPELIAKLNLLRGLFN